MYAKDVSEFDAVSLVASIANVLAYHLLFREKDFPETERERVTELLNVYAGYGIFVANAALVNVYEDLSHEAVRKRNFLATQEFGYSLAVYANVRGEKSSAWQHFLSQMQ